MQTRPRSILLLLALGLVAGAPALVPFLAGRVVAYRDLVEFFLPMRVYLHDALMAGRLPLWDPWTFCGRPFLANLQSQVLYPPNLLACLLPMPLAYGLYAALHLGLGAAGTTVWARAWGVRPAAAAAGGLAFGLSGPMVAVVELSNNLATMAWWPWAGWAAGRLAGTGRPLPLVALIAALCGAGLGGEPHMALLAGLLALASGLLLPLPDSEGESPAPRRRLSLVLLAGLFALGLLLVQVLPFLELVRQSDRSAGLSREEAARHSLPFPAFAGYLEADRLAYTPAPGNERIDQPWLRLRYGGALPLAASILGLAWLRGGAGGTMRRAAALAATLVGGGWALALGPATPLFPVMQRAGILWGFRYPVKFLLPAALGLALLAALGLERVLRFREEGRLRPALLLAWVPAAAAAGLALTGRPGFLHALLAGAAGVATLALVPRHRAASAALALVAADLLAAHVGVLPTAHASTLYAETEASQAARAADTRVYPRPPSLESLVSAWRPDEARPWEEYARGRVRLMGGNVPQALGVRSMRGAAALAPRLQAELLAAADAGPAGLPVIRGAGAGLFVSHAGLPLEGLDPLPGSEAHLYRVSGSLPRAWLARQWLVTGDTLAMLDRPEVASGRLVLLADPPRLEGEPALVTGETSILPGRDEPGRVSWEVHTPDPALLVLLDSWYPGWKAEVDGRPAQVLRANHAFRAVALPAGRHSVTLRYSPLSVRAGGALSLLAFLLLVVLLPRMERGGDQPS